MSIFRAYDIRGVYPSQLNGDLAYKIGLAFGAFIGRGTVALGADVRTSSPDLRRNLLRGLTGAGLDVIDVGFVPTPVLYFTVASSGIDGGTMITGSHNAKEYNGIKLCGKKGLCLSYETGIGKVEAMVKAGPQKSGGGGKATEKRMDDAYINFIVKNIRLKRPLSVVIDAGNGVAGRISCALFRKLGCKVTELHCEPDGNFPNHHPDPLVRANLKDLQTKVKEANADVGIAYDGDGDRVGFVDEKGIIIENNKAFALLIKSALAKNSGAKIVQEILSSKLVADVIKSSGGVSIVSKVGHSYIQEIMAREKCILGGETSGHYYFSESYNYDDGIFASAKIAELLSDSKEKLSQMVASLPQYITSDDTRIHCPDDKKFQVVENLKKKLGAMGRLTIIDGVRVDFKDSWFIIRASNTQPALVLRWEANSESEFKRLEKLVRAEVDKEIASLA
ncbi:MAG: phosphomannomutase/phosphoglucomutase [Candidatus Aenigmatarchaeota archaeon]